MSVRGRKGQKVLVGNGYGRSGVGVVSETLSRRRLKHGGRVNKVRIRVGQLFRQVGVKLDAFANFALLLGFGGGGQTSAFTYVIST